MEQDAELEPTIARLREMARSDPRGAAMLAIYLEHTWAPREFLYSGRRRHELAAFSGAVELSVEDRARLELYTEVRSKLERPPGSSLAVRAPGGVIGSPATWAGVSVVTVGGLALLDPGYALIAALMSGFWLWRLWAWKGHSDAREAMNEPIDAEQIAGPGFEERQRVIESEAGRRAAALIEEHPGLAFDAMPGSRTPFR